MGTNAVLSPWETTSALTSIRPPQVRNHQRASRGRGVRPIQHRPQLHQQQKKTQTGECRDRGFEGGYSSQGCQPTEPPDCGYGPPKATVSCARPLSPATGPSQDFRPAATACKERHQMDTIQKNNQERALHTSDTSMEGVHSPLI